MARKSTSRSTSEDGAAAHAPPDTLVAGVILGAHGVRGELKIAPDSDNPDRFRAGRRIIVDGLGERTLTSVRGAGGTLIVRLEGVDDRESAEKLSRRDLRVPLEQARAEASGYLWADLVGMRVEDEAGNALGTLVDVLRSGGVTDVFVVRAADGHELLLPAIEDVVRTIDVAVRRMVVRPQQEA